jgi:hypothetical protein
MIGVTLLYLAVHLVAQGVLGGAGLAAAPDAPLAAAAGACSAGRGATCCSSAPPCRCSATPAA